MNSRQFVEALKAHDRYVKRLPGGRRANFTLQTLGGLRLPGVNLQSAILSGTDLSESDLKGADLSLTDLYGSDFSRANLSNANLKRADIRGAIFQGAQMTGADMTGADLRPGAYMDSALKLTGPQHSKALQWRARKLRASIGDTSFKEARMDYVTMDDTDMFRCDLSNANMQYAGMSSANIKGARFANTNLAHADFTGSTLENVDFRGALLYGTMFENTKFVDVQMPVAVETLAIDVQDRLAQHQRWLATLGVEGAPADFTDCDLQGENLTGLNLTGANFTRAKMSEAVLDGCILNLANFREADMTMAILDNATCNGAYMAGTVLRFASCRRTHFGMSRLWRHNMNEERGEPWPTNMAGVDLKGAALHNAAFDRTVLKDANMLEVRVGGTRFRGCKTDEGFFSYVRDRGALVYR